MSTLKEDQLYKCYDDCRPSGCPGHKMHLELQNTSEILIIYPDWDRNKDHYFGFEPNEWKAFKEALVRFNYDLFDLSSPS